MRPGRTLKRMLAGGTMAVAMAVPLAAPAQATDVSVANWHGFVNLGGPKVTAGLGVFEPIGLARGLVVLGRGPDGELMIRARDQSDKWLDWEPFGGALSGRPAAVLTNNIYSAEVYYKAPDDSIMMSTAGAMPGGRWIRTAQPIVNLGGDVRSSPAVTKTRDDQVDVFARSTNGQLKHTWRYGTQWAGWEDLGGQQFQGSPTAVSWKGGNEIHLFAKGNDNGLLHRWWTATGGWADWENLGGSLSSEPSALRFHDNRLDVFARGARDTLIHKWWDGGAGWSGWEDLGGSLQSAPAVNPRNYHPIHVLAAGNTGQLEHSWWG